MNVSRITIGRLFNLGNYEHERFEISVDLAAGENARHALENVSAILNSLNPTPPFGVPSLDEVVRLENRYKHEVALSPDEWERNRPYIPSPGKGRIECLADLKAESMTKRHRYEKWKGHQQRALDALNELGGSISWKDAKLDWDDHF
jgi:hypothetical protein